jgi:hypothetical protein
VRTEFAVARKETLMPNFMQEWWFIGLMIVLLVVLLGVFFYLRKQGAEED